MHLAIIISRYKPYIGGAEKQAERMAEAMIMKGFQVTVLTRRWGTLPSYENSGGVSVQRLPFLAWGMLAPLTFLC
ncbi:MAG: hypothetical protein PHY90_01250, partial [Desulfitobacteriaceae bacterium]|nr:hypothetical protein [Desulfitobacteriaceae bacterium]